MSFVSDFEAISPIIRDLCGGDVARIAATDAGPWKEKLVGKFDNNFLLVMADENGGMESRGPVFEYLSSDYPNPDHGFLLDVGGARYSIVGIRPSQNFTLLVLEKH